MYSQKRNCAALLFPKQNYNFLSAYFHIELHIPGKGLAIFAAAKLADWSWEYLIRSQIHECRKWEGGRTVSFLEINKSDFRYSAAPPPPLPATSCSLAPRTEVAHPPLLPPSLPPLVAPSLLLAPSHSLPPPVSPSLLLALQLAPSPSHPLVLLPALSPRLPALLFFRMAS